MIQGVSLPVIASFHRKIVNKPDEAPFTGENGETLTGYKCNGRWVSLAKDWVYEELSYQAAFNKLTVEGRAICPVLLGERRKASEFMAIQLMLLDFDDGKLSDLANNDFYKECGGGFYTSPSHTEEAHRYRVIHRLVTPETDYQRARLAIRGLMSLYPGADPACKDPIRLFYGKAKPAHSEIRENVIDDEVYHELVLLGERLAPTKAEYNDKHYDPPSDSDKTAIIAALTSMGKLRKDNDGPVYQQWRDIGWGMKAGGFTEADFLHVTPFITDSKSPEFARSTWSDGQANGGIKLGTVFYMINKYSGVNVSNLLNDKKDNPMLGAPKFGAGDWKLKQAISSKRKKTS